MPCPRATIKLPMGRLVHNSINDNGIEVAEVAGDDGRCRNELRAARRPLQVRDF